MIIRQIKTADAEEFIQLVQQVEREAAYMLFEPGERDISVEQQRERIKVVEQDEHSAIFLAEKKHHLAGYLMAIGSSANRNKHTIYLVVGILDEYRWQGVGTNLFEQLENWATEQSVHRMELTVVTRNEAGLALYKKRGFEIEGTKRDSLLINGEYLDEYYMAKLL
ncbi:MAG TPA: GNAT family N-acetyltransferase [Virgibacillus sp.]|nr:GNAT family N-acetyltransferase [Virgibacillus sp.]